MRLGPPPADMAGWVAELASPPRAKRAYRHLVAAGPPALPAVRAGLADPNADVRMYCTQALDHLVDGKSFPLLVALLGDDDARVRGHALHALACDRCKTTTCRPAKADVLP
ncbi:MAG TPA: HEAT repeat domain-containing protein, partial [Acidimicrobiales bacterium]|nr:HEAT repeat domain-containing protein [Acidimicrobiales bacterium]